MHKNNERKKRILKAVYRSLMMCIAFFSAMVLWYWNASDGWQEGYTGYTTLFCVGCLYCIVYWFFAHMYEAQKIGLYRLTELLYFQFLSFGIAGVTLFVESVFWFHGLERLKIYSYIIVLLGQLGLIAVVIFVCNRIFALYDAPRKILVVYGSDSYKDLVANFRRKKFRYEIVQCMKDTEDIDKIQAYIDQCESIYLCEINNTVKKQLVLYCSAVQKDVYITQDVEDIIMRNFDVSHTFDIPFIRTKRTPVKWYYPFVKRFIDILCSGLALIILSPVFLIVAICIKAYDKGPVFYKQIRLTKGHKEFEIYKFRSMIIDAEKNGARLSSQNDDRITPIGKFIRMTRIDELPQLINILKGDMSIVGPRPERPEIEKAYLEELPEFGLRLQVPAGLSGYAQIFGKYNTTPRNKLKLDLFYINQRSLLMDFKIIFYTIKIIFIPESTEGVEQVTTYTDQETSVDPKED